MGPKIVINAIGTLGDLHPLIAIAQDLKVKGLNPVFATSHDYVEKVENAGFEAHGIVEGHLKLAANMGLTEEQFMRKLMTNQKKMMEDFVIAPLAQSVENLETHIDGAIAIIGSPFSYAGHIIADKYGLKFIMTVLQPGLIVTCYDPIITPEIPVFISPARNPFTRLWNRFWIFMLKFIGRILFGKSINRVRIKHGIATKPSLPTFEATDAVLFLGLYSELLGGLQPDMYPQTYITGFPEFDSQSGRAETLDPALKRFLDRGPPPLIFGLGSLAFHASGDFFEQSLKVAKTMKMRAVILTGQPIDLPHDKDIFITDYAPHAEIFPFAAAIIHHGGIGSTGRALKAGKPQLITPFNGDQFDNARRVKRLGVGDSLPIKKYNAVRAERKLKKLLSDPTLPAIAQKHTQQLLGENGAENAVKLIIDYLDLER